MPHVTSFRLLLSSANHHHRHPFSAAPRFFSQNPFLSSLPFFSKTYIKKHDSLPYFTTFSSYNKRPDSKINKNSRSSNMNQSSFRGTVKNKDSDSNKGGLLAMEEKSDNTKSGDEGFGFNRKRAEGRDESDRNKKNLQLKVRKLNPINTIAYVQRSLFLAPGLYL